MLFRVLERYAPSLLLAAFVAALGTVIFGLEFGATFFAAYVTAEIGHWLDTYGQR